MHFNEVANNLLGILCFCRYKCIIKLSLGHDVLFLIFVFKY